MSDPVNHPSHYTDGKIEVADFIADKNMNFFLGNVVKYVSRAGKKDPETLVEDLRKAAWYLNREIERVNPTVETVEVLETAWEKANKELMAFRDSRLDLSGRRDKDAKSDKPI